MLSGYEACERAGGLEFIPLSALLDRRPLAKGPPRVSACHAGVSDILVFEVSSIRVVRHKGTSLQINFLSRMLKPFDPEGVFLKALFRDEVQRASAFEVLCSSGCVPEKVLRRRVAKDRRAP